jgi:hypothetical protein
MIEEPLLAAGNIRLYRVGKLPKDCRFSGITTESSEFHKLDWRDQTIVERGDHNAWGRWFAGSRSEADWYAEHENWGAPLYYIDVPERQAASWLVAHNDEAKKFSARPSLEYFLPIDIANQALPMPGYVPPRTSDGLRVSQVTTEPALPAVCDIHIAAKPAP